MSLANIFVIFSFFVVLNSSYSTNFVHNSSKTDHNLSKSICKITNDITSSTIDTQDILIGNLDDKVLSTTVNNILKCIHHETSVVVTDFRSKITETRLWKAAVVVLVMNEANEVCRSLKNIKYFETRSLIFKYLK